MSVIVTTLGADCGADNLNVSVSAPQGSYLLIDNEYMLVTSNGISRGFLGSQAKPHKGGSQVLIAGVNSDFPWIREYAGLAPTSGQIQEDMNWPATLLFGTSDVLDPNTAAFYLIKTPAVDNVTIGPPIAAGTIISVFSDTPFAHTVSSTVTLTNGLQYLQKIAFPSVQGAGVILQAAKGVWTIAAGT
jgi:hypothetical protein